jgi:hypothetical protein
VTRVEKWHTACVEPRKGNPHDSQNALHRYGKRTIDGKRSRAPSSSARENDCHLAVLVIGIALPASTTAYGAVPAETWSEEREKGRAEATEKATEIEA